MKDCFVYHSHTIGDQVLRGVAEWGGKNARHLDVLGRYGGEEFVILLPETDRTRAAKVARRVRNSVEVMTWAIDRGTIRVTISCGVAQVT